MKYWFAMLLLISPLYAETEASQASAYIRMGDINSTNVDGVYQLSTRLDISLSEEMQDALRNGVRQVYLLEVQVRVPRFQLYYTEAASEKHRYELRFHTLSRKYLVNYLRTKTQRSFYTLSAALEYMGNIESLTVLKGRQLSDFDNFQIRAKFMLDIDELPLPLQIHSLMNRGWRISSKWKVIEL